ncbi:MAG: YdcF family protein [Erysipelotrichaceae bacterium]|nr:YdcF family protein [Erysipelotrichaceae bacterium]
MKLFDTLDKKPKLYHIAILSAAVFIIVFLLLEKGMEHIVTVNLILGLYYLSVIALLVHAFIGQLRYNPYSYNTILYFGYALYVGLLLLTQISVIRQYYLDPEMFYEERVFAVVSGSFGNFIILSFPFLLVFCVALCISNIVLLRHEGRSFVNVLGIILSAMIIAGVLIYLKRSYYIMGSQREVMFQEMLNNIFAAVYLYFECMLLGTMAAGYLVTRYVPDYDRDYMIILGCAMFKDGTPTPLLRARIDAALDFYHKQLNATGKKLKFITSGGQGSNEIFSESLCMKKYLMKKGIQEDEILEEDRSTTTYENMLYSKKLIEDELPKAKVSFSTNNFHVFRAGLFARRVKMRATGIGSKTKWYFWPNAAVREFVGLLSKHRLKQLLVLLGTIVVAVVFTMLEYR